MCLDKTPARVPKFSRVVAYPITIEGIPVAHCPIGRGAEAQLAATPWMFFVPGATLFIL
jgi:hypothetical protein